MGSRGTSSLGCLIVRSGTTTAANVPPGVGGPTVGALENSAGRLPFGNVASKFSVARRLATATSALAFPALAAGASGAGRGGAGTAARDNEGTGGGGALPVIAIDGAATTGVGIGNTGSRLDGGGGTNFLGLGCSGGGATLVSSFATIIGAGRS